MSDETANQPTSPTTTTTEAESAPAPNAESAPTSPSAGAAGASQPGEAASPATGAPPEAEAQSPQPGDNPASDAQSHQPGDAEPQPQSETSGDTGLNDQDLDALMAEAEQANEATAAGTGETSTSAQSPAAGGAGESASAGHDPATADGSTQTGEGEAQPAAEIHHDMRRGRISAIRGEDVFVDLPGDTGKLQGVVPLTQFDRTPRIGAIMDFVVDHTDETQGLIYLSREGAISRATWQQLQPGASVEARVISTNKGGLELEMVGGIRAFMPTSQVDQHHIEDLQPWIGEKVAGIVQEIDRKSKKVVLSRRQYLEQEAARKKQALLKELAEGQTCEGKVTSLTKFGAFVDIGGVEGLVHVSDLSYSHIDKPSDVVEAGQTVTVKVLSIDREKERIGLGLKQVQPDPWESIESRYAVGSQVEAKVMRTAKFGAFVELEPGVEALLPMSEMSWRRVTKASEVVQPGDKLWMKVLTLDPENRKLSVSLKQAQGDPWVGAEHKYAAGSWVEGTVRSLTDFGAFIELEPGVEGLVHISELAPRRVEKVSDVVQQGETRQVRVLEVDEQERKMRLSLKPAEGSQSAEGQQASDQAQAGQGAAEGKQAGKKPQGKAKQRKKPENLRGGMDPGGVGLGGLRPEDFK